MKTYTVSQCNELIQKALQREYVFRHIAVRGMISGLHLHFSGQAFFSLVDKQVRLSCLIGREHFRFLTRQLKNHEEASVIGDVKFNKIGGKPVLYVEQIIGRGESALYKQETDLETELRESGYFAEERKKVLPLFPSHIGIVTSDSGAVWHDIVTTGRRRNDSVRYSVYAAPVQGEGASLLMADRVDCANADADAPDILIVARGGGEEEDLRPFNERPLLEAVYRSTIPVISAVGHETDVTLLDRTADVRASTPTQAAEIAVPNKTAIKNILIERIHRLRYACSHHLVEKKAECRYRYAWLHHGKTEEALKREKERISSLNRIFRLVWQARMEERYHLLAKNLWRLQKGRIHDEA